MVFTDERELVMSHIQVRYELVQIRSVMSASVLIIALFGPLDPFTETHLTINQASAQPLSFLISEVNAPHPKHCLDQRQWQNPQSFNPYNLFDQDRTSVWQLCDYAIKDPGYTVNFTLNQPITIDGFILKQVLEHASTKTQGGRKQRRLKRRRRAKGSTDHLKIDDQLKRFKRMQIIFFNSQISQRYPVYFQEIKFDGAEQVALEYRKMMTWNPILIGDSLFDERRRALGLDPKGMTPPIKVDKVGLVFWDYEGKGEPPALAELTLTLGGKHYQAKHVPAQKLSYGQRIGKAYDLLTRDYMFIGDDRALIFSRSGTIWGMEGEEEVAKVMGAWRFVNDRVEVDLSSRQKGRTSARRRKVLKRRRKNSYQPLHLIVDEAPTRAYILNSALAGEYDMTRAPIPTQALEADQDETPPPFEAP